MRANIAQSEIRARAIDQRIAILKAASWLIALI